MFLFVQRFLIAPKQGFSTTCWLASEPENENLTDKRLHEIRWQTLTTLWRDEMFVELILFQELNQEISQSSGYLFAFHLTWHIYQLVYMQNRCFILTRMILNVFDVSFFVQICCTCIINVAYQTGFQTNTAPGKTIFFCTCHKLVSTIIITQAKLCPVYLLVCVCLIFSA